MDCLLKGPDCEGGIQEAHWPKAKGMGGTKADLPTVYLCLGHHAQQHAAHRPTILRLIAKAPVYWMVAGQWEKAKPYYDRFVARTEYRESMED